MSLPPNFLLLPPKSTSLLPPAVQCAAPRLAERSVPDRSRLRVSLQKNSLIYAFYMWLIKSELYTFSETWPVALATMVCSIALAWLCLKFYDEPVRKWLGKFAG